MEYDVKNIKLDFLKSREEIVKKISRDISQEYIKKFLMKGYNLDIDIYVIEKLDKKNQNFIKEYTSYICLTLLKNNDIIEYEDGVLENDIIIIYKNRKKFFFEEMDSIKEEIIETLEYYLKCIENIENGNWVVY